MGLWWDVAHLPAGIKNLYMPSLEASIGPFYPGFDCFNSKSLLVNSCEKHQTSYKYIVSTVYAHKHACECVCVCLCRQNYLTSTSCKFSAPRKKHTFCWHKRCVCRLAPAKRWLLWARKSWNWNLGCRLDVRLRIKKKKNSTNHPKWWLDSKKMRSLWTSK